MIFCAKFYFSAQMATMAIGNANPEYILFSIFCLIKTAEINTLRNFPMYGSLHD